jgi:hypothetical protein
MGAASEGKESEYRARTRRVRDRDAVPTFEGD